MRILNAEDYATEEEMIASAEASVYPPCIFEESVSITIRHPDQIVALSTYLAQMIRETNTDYVQHKKDARSSMAVDCAVVNGFANEMVLQLRKIWQENYRDESPPFLETNDEKISRLRNAAPSTITQNF